MRYAEFLEDEHDQEHEHDFSTSAFRLNSVPATWSLPEWIIVFWKTEGLESPNLIVYYRDELTRYQ